jgi:adenine-specific DNA-methyltransferase
MKLWQILNELTKKYSQTFIEQIEAANDTATLLQIWEQMKTKSF